VAAQPGVYPAWALVKRWVDNNVGIGGNVGVHDSAFGLPTLTLGYTVRGNPTPQGDADDPDQQ
jgi:hypothetical protein